jgi:hypothetical protein
VVPKVTWEQALAWRMRRHYLDPIGDRPMTEVVHRLCGVQAQVASSAELAVRVRRKTSKSGDIARALREGRLIKTWAMRGTLHLLTPEDAGAFLSLLAAGRSWELPSWERWFGISPAQHQAMRVVVREALDGKTLTREELVAAVIRRRGFGHVGDAMRSGWGSLLKPLAWQGDLCFGPSQGARVTFMRPDQVSTRWTGVPDPDEAAPIAIGAYLRCYGPATAQGFRNFVTRGRLSARRVRNWFDALRPKLAEVEVGAERASVMPEHIDELLSIKPSRAVRLVPAFDQFVMGPGTDDGHVVSVKRRRAVSRQAGWIAPVVLAGGVARGTWQVAGDDLVVEWFTEGGATPRAALHAEAARLGSILDRELRLQVRRV